MAYFQIDNFSTVMDMETSLKVVIPREITTLEEAPIVLLLHGLSDNCSGWARYTCIERFARKYKVILVMPEVQRSFYTDMEYGLKYFSYISQELPSWIKQTFNLKGDFYVAGLSMGGYGAMKCYLTNRSLFKGCGAFSSVTRLQKRVAIDKGDEFQAIFGLDKAVPSFCDIFSLLKKQVSDTQIYLTCGTEDKLYEDNLEFARELKKHGTDNQVCFSPGSHSWEFWEQSLLGFLDYFFKERLV